MAGYVKEVLRDHSLLDQEQVEAGSEFHISRIDLYDAIEHLYNRGVLKQNHVLALNALFLGHQRAMLESIPGVNELLSFALKQVEYYAGIEYTDDYFVDRALTKYPNYATMKHVFVRRLIELGDAL